MTQKSYLSSHIRVVNAIFGPKHISVGLKPLLLISEISHVFIWATKCNLCYLEPNHVNINPKPYVSSQKH